MFYYTKTVEQALDELNTTENGLAVSEAAERLRRYGQNTVKIADEPLWSKLLEPFRDVFMFVLLLAGAISLFHGELLDASIIGTIMAISAVIYYVQRFSTDRILRALQKRSQQTVQTLRDGKPVSLESVLLVPGDIIILGEGEKIPADARLVSASALRVDESQLTGESQPVSKQIERLSEDKEIYEQSNLIFQGSFIVSGEAMAVIIHTGNDTEFGQLAALTKGRDTISPVQVKIDKLISQIIAVVGAISLVAFGLSIFRGIDIAESLRFVLALAVSAVPEGLPVAISVILVLGMRRMAARKALVRTMRAIETVGILTTIATDKTGTLTKNKLTVHDIWQPKGSRTNLPAILAKTVNSTVHGTHDPLDIAIDEFASSHHVKKHKQQPLVKLPFNHGVSMSGNVWHRGKEYELAVKGAPEHVLARCDLTEGERENLDVVLGSFATEGYRVIAVATTTISYVPEKIEDLKKKDRLSFAGFIAVADVLRPEAKKAIADALAAGVSVRMITGDHFETAFHIARQLGMVTQRDQVFDCRRMNMMSDAELERTIDSVRVFSRVIPEYKYRILALLKKHNITAMTGDGVNDVPALVGAHVGVAMGSGASIAKEAGDIILLDDNFKSIVDAMREGRTIFANIRRMLFYLLSTNAGEVITVLGALVIGMPPPLAPVQILWVNLVTDTSMVIPLGLEPGEKTAMQQKPKEPNAPILTPFMISRMIIVAISMAIITLVLYITYRTSHGLGYAQTIAFNALVVMQWASAFSARSDQESLWSRIRVFSPAFYIGLGVAVMLQFLVLFGPLGDVFHVTHVFMPDVIFSSALSFGIIIVLMETHKFIGRRRVYN
jgi:Ca2+-transporting ATPase